MRKAASESLEPVRGRPWFAIVWFAVWGSFQAFAVASVLRGTWERPPAFPEGVYESLVFPDVVFIPIYLTAAALLAVRHWAGNVLALVSAGGILYVLIYLLALSGFSGTVNLVADTMFLAFTLVALWQVVRFARPRATA
jgi:hypothetical protein